MKISTNIKKYLAKRYSKRLGLCGIQVSYPYALRGIISPQNVFLNDYVSIGPDCLLYATINSKIIIGKGTILAPRCKIYSSNHHYDGDDLAAVPYDNINIVSDVNVGIGVWIGDSVIILPGVTIGNGAIIAAGSIVVSDIPDYAIAAGNPAKVKKYRDPAKFNQLVNEGKFNRSINWNISYGGKKFVLKSK